MSRVLSKSITVSAETTDKVVRAVAELGYRPNTLAASLTTGRTYLIGLLSDNYKNPAFLEIFDLFTRLLQERGLRPLLVNLTGNHDPAKGIQMLKQYSVDGAIVASSTLPPTFSEDIKKAGIPVVHSFGRCQKPTSVSVVGVDNVLCGRVAAQCLIERGYRALGFLGGPKNASTSQDRLQGFSSALQAVPDTTLNVHFTGSYTYDAGFDGMRKQIGEKQAEAYFCGDDVIAIGAMSAVREAGLLVPGDIGLIGMNDMQASGWEHIGLSTIRQPVSEIVEASIDLVTAMIERPDHCVETRAFSCRFIERKTLRPV